jgi:hypothetical protein
VLIVCIDDWFCGSVQTLNHASHSDKELESKSEKANCVKLQTSKKDAFFKKNNDNHRHFGVTLLETRFLIKTLWADIHENN